MAFEIVHSVEKAIVQLLEAPYDLAALIPDQGKGKLISAATDEHRSLFAQYLADFVVVYEIGDDWWSGCVQAQVDDGHDQSKAVELAYENRLAGPTSAPEVVWFFRKYWLAFDEINRRVLAKDRVPPQVALLGWLVDSGMQEYVRFLTCMPYWPIGLDENGNWC